MGRVSETGEVMGMVAGLMVEERSRVDEEVEGLWRACQRDLMALKDTELTMVGPSGQQQTLKEFAL